MNLITKNEKWKLYLVDPDEVFDILSKGDGKGLYCGVLKGEYQKTTHELRNLKVVDIKTYIESAKNNDGYGFIIFYMVVENKGDRKLRFLVDGEHVEFVEKEVIEAKKICSSGPCGSQICPLACRSRCTVIIDKYENGEFWEVDE